MREEHCLSYCSPFSVARLVPRRLHRQSPCYRDRENFARLSMRDESWYIEDCNCQEFLQELDCNNATLRTHFCPTSCG